VLNGHLQDVANLMREHLLVRPLFAQRDLATLVGTVTDPSGGIIPNAKVTITEVGTGQVYNLLTTGTGDFVRPALKPSVYNITVVAPGFRTADGRSDAR
jgi:hypothetical protein